MKVDKSVVVVTQTKVNLNREEVDNIIISYVKGSIHPPPDAEIAVEYVGGNQDNKDIIDGVVVSVERKERRNPPPEATQKPK